MMPMRRATGIAALISRSCRGIRHWPCYRKYGRKVAGMVSDDLGLGGRRLKECNDVLGFDGGAGHVAIGCDLIALRA